MNPKNFIILAAFSLLSAACNHYPPPQSPPIDYSARSAYDQLLIVNDHFIDVELAITQEAWRQGLSGRTSLGPEQGMLFDMRSIAPTRPGFWMKDMKFPLDLIWIRNNKIVDITRDVSVPLTADTQLPQYHPSADIDMVLEVNAGWSAAHQTKIGDPVTLVSPM